MPNKRLVFMSAFTRALSLSLLLATAWVQAEEPLRFGTFENTNSPGLVTCEQVLREAYAQLGRSIVIEHLPGQRSLYWAKSGRLDGDLCRSQAVDGLLKVTTPIYQWKLVAFSNRPLTINSWEDLRPYRIGYERGMLALAKHKELDLLPANSIETAVLQLSKSRVDVLINDHNSVVYIAKKMGIDNLIANQPPLLEGGVYHLLNSQHQALAEQLNKVLEDMTRSGRIQQIEQEVLEEFMQRAEHEHVSPSESSGPTE